MSELSLSSKNVIQEFQSEIDEIKETEVTCKQEITDLRNIFETDKKNLKEKADQELKILKDKRSTDSKEKEDLENKIAGAITCPKCSYEFTLRYKDFDVESSKVKVEELKLSLVSQDKVIEETQIKLNNEYKEREAKFNTELKELEDIEKTLVTQKEDVNNRIKAKRETFNTQYEDQNTLLIQERGYITKVGEEKSEYEKRIKGIDDKIRDSITKIGTIDFKLSQIELAIKLIEGQITQLNKESDIEEKVLELEVQIEDLMEEETKLKTQLESEEQEKKRKEEWLLNFKNFKSYLANQSIKNIGDYTNFYLNSIQSNITIQIEGYRMLAGGKKLKEEITTTVYKDGFEEGSYGTFSAGERGRIIICNILGLQELINLNAGPGKGLDLLICDEILDSIDTLGLELLINALQGLQKTIMIVSQNEIQSLSSTTVVIQKQNKISTVLTQ